MHNKYEECDPYNWIPDELSVLCQRSVLLKLDLQASPLQDITMSFFSENGKHIVCYIGHS
jgi:hypothetical protein